MKDDINREFDEWFYRIYGAHEGPHSSSAMLEAFNRSMAEKLAVAREEGRKEGEIAGRLKTIREIFVNYGLDFTEEGVKKAMADSSLIRP